jgi:CPA2 family monovalent cation:H+ antiporter-2
MNGVASIAFLQDLAIVMIAAGLVTLVFHKLRQPVVLGYLLAGFLIGPHMAPFPLIQNEQSIRTLSELGVIFIIFSVGMQFSLRTLKQVGSTAFIAALLEVLVMFWIGYQLGVWFGWGKMDSVFLGAMLSITSTTIIAKTLTELGLLKARFTSLIVGISIIEDILGIAIIGLLSGVAVTGSWELADVGMAAGRVSIFIVVVLVAGLIVVPPLLHRVAQFKSDEMLLVTVVGLCFGVSLAAVKLGFSLALGAFLIGTVVGEAREIGKIKVLTEPVRDMFSAVFFVATGMLINPTYLQAYWLPILLIAVAVIVGKATAFSFGTFLAGHDTRTALRVGSSMVPIGELSFIIAALGDQLKVTSDFLYPIAVGVAAITMPVSPLLIKNSDRIVGWFDRVAPKSFVAYLELYSRWVERLRTARGKPGRVLLRKWLFQMALNVALVTGVFIAAAYLSRYVEEWLPNVPRWIGGAKGLAWLAAALLGLPGMIAVLRKLDAFAMLFAEMSVSRERAGTNTAAIRNVVSRTVFIAGILGLGLWVLAVSAPFLTTLSALSVLLVIVGIVAGLFWKFFISVHARAQVALRESLAENPPTPIQELPLTTVLKGARLETIILPQNCAASGKLIRELELRTRTGASIVGIERATATIINPSPEEELQAGDTLFLLGTTEQLGKAREMMCAEKANQ